MPLLIERDMELLYNIAYIACNIISHIIIIISYHISYILVYLYLYLQLQLMIYDDDDGKVHTIKQKFHK